MCYAFLDSHTLHTYTAFAMRCDLQSRIARAHEAAKASQYYGGSVTVTKHVVLHLDTLRARRIH